jgi:hypothetical protein
MHFVGLVNLIILSSQLSGSIYIQEQLYLTHRPYFVSFFFFFWHSWSLIEFPKVIPSFFVRTPIYLEQERVECHCTLPACYVRRIRNDRLFHGVKTCHRRRCLRCYRFKVQIFFTRAFHDFLGACQMRKRKKRLYCRYDSTVFVCC